MESIKTLTDIILYLATTGVLTKEDIKVICEVEPQLRILLENWEYFSRKYRPEILAEYIWSLLSKYRRGDIVEQIKLVSLYIYRVPHTKLKLYVPFISQVIAEIEKRLVEAGLMDHRLERLFNELYDVLSKGTVSHNEITTILNRVLAFVGKAMSKQREESSAPSLAEAAKEALKVIRPKKSGKITEDEIKKVVEVVYEYNSKGQRPVITKVLGDVVSKGIIRDPRRAYDVLKKAIEDDYLSEDSQKRVEVTDKGKELIGVK